MINSIQQGMAEEASFQGIVDLVGDRLREVFDTGNVLIIWWDATAGYAHYLYAYQRGVRVSIAPTRPNLDGPMIKAFMANRPVVANNRAEMTALGLRTVPGTEPSLSTAQMPFFAGDRFLGTIALDNHERENAYGEAEVRLLSTVAASMGMALQNARHFDETQRLLQETERRAAELAVINSIQQGMAAALNFQAIIDLVGDKLREVLNTGNIGIRWFDPQSELIHFLYEYEHGQRLQIEPMARIAGGPAAQMERTRRPVVLNSRAEMAAAGIRSIPGTDTSLSVVFVPIVGSDRLIGTIVLEDHSHENAFGDADVRLLSTVASSMGVALENARLFDETQRLLKETEQRNAELAVINRIQQGIAGSLDFQAIVDLVGDKLREVLHTQDMGIRWIDHAHRTVHYLYEIEHGVRLQIPAGSHLRRALRRSCRVKRRAGAAPHGRRGGGDPARAGHRRRHCAAPRCRSSAATSCSARSSSRASSANTPSATPSCGC